MRPALFQFLVITAIIEFDIVWFMRSRLIYVCKRRIQREKKTKEKRDKRLIAS